MLALEFMDYMLHTLFDRLKSVTWSQYDWYTPHQEYYYAGDGLYLIHDRKFDFYWLVKAEDPDDALAKAKSEWKRRA